MQRLNAKRFQDAIGCVPGPQAHDGALEEVMPMRKCQRDAPDLVIRQVDGERVRLNTEVERPPAVEAMRQTLNLCHGDALWHLLPTQARHDSSVHNKVIQRQVATIRVQQHALMNLHHRLLAVSRLVVQHLLACLVDQISIRVPVKSNLQRVHDAPCVNIFNSSF